MQCTSFDFKKPAGIKAMHGGYGVLIKSKE
jgi:hypothetical protein